MCKALVQAEDMDLDPTSSRPRRGDVIALVSDNHEFGAKDLHARRVVTLPGPAREWEHLLGAGGRSADELPTYRQNYLDDQDAVQRRVAVLSAFG